MPDPVTKAGDKEANMGFAMMRSDPLTLRLMDEVIELSKEHPSWDDQKLTNTLLSSKKEYRPIRHRLNGTEYANGCFLRNNKGLDLRKLGTKVVHLNCSLNKGMKLAMYCGHQLWFCGRTPPLELVMQGKIRAAVERGELNCTYWSPSQPPQVL